MSLESVSAESIITYMCEQFIMPHQEVFGHSLWDKDPLLGLYFCLSIDAENYGYEKDGNTHHEDWRRRYSVNLHFIVTARHRVYVAKTDWLVGLKDVPNEAWVNTSNHDSCWRSDGFDMVHRELMNAREECLRDIPEEHQQHAVHFHNYLNSGIFGPRGMLNFVRIERQPHPDEKIRQGGYRDSIKSVTPVKFRVQTLEE